MEPLFTTWSSGPLTILVGSAKRQKESIKHHTAGSQLRNSMKGGVTGKRQACTSSVCRARYSELSPIQMLANKLI